MHTCLPVLVPEHWFAIVRFLANVVALKQSDVFTDVFLGDVQKTIVRHQAEPERVAVCQSFVQVFGALLWVLVLQPLDVPSDLCHERRVEHILWSQRDL